MTLAVADDALGGPLFDAARGKRLRAEIAEVSSKNQVALDRFFERHAEFAAIQEA